MRLKNVFAGVFVVAIVGGCNSSDASSSMSSAACAPPPRHNTFRVLVLGDSIAAGYPFSAPNRWSDMLERDLRQSLPVDVQLTNDARSATQVDFLESSVAAHDDLSIYQMAIVIEGVNDIGVTPHSEWESRYQAAIDGIQAKGPAVIIGTSPPILAHGQFLDASGDVAETLRQIATYVERPVLDIDRAWRKVGAVAAAELYADTIHPSLEGQAKIADMALEIALSHVLDCRMRPGSDMRIGSPGQP